MPSGVASRGRSGWTTSQQMEPTTARTAAAQKELVQPKRCAIQGVSEAVTAPPICPPIFTMLEKTPELRPAISPETEKKELCDRYRVPAPPARMSPARPGL